MRKRGTDLRRCGDVHNQSLAHASGYEKHRNLRSFSIQNQEVCNFKTHAADCYNNRIKVIKLARHSIRATQSGRPA